MSDSYVQVAADSTGKKLDTTAVTRSDGTTLVQRERVVISDPSNPLLPDASVGSRGLFVDSRLIRDELIAIRELLTEIRNHQFETLR